MVIMAAENKEDFGIKAKLYCRTREVHVVVKMKEDDKAAIPGAQASVITPGSGRLKKVLSETTFKQPKKYLKIT